MNQNSAELGDRQARACDWRAMRRAGEEVIVQGGAILDELDRVCTDKARWCSVAHSHDIILNSILAQF